MSGSESDPLLEAEKTVSAEHEGELSAVHDEGNDSESAPRGCRAFCRAVPILVVLTCACNAMPSGLTYSTSYLISPTSRACSSAWSKSATVYGASAVAAGSLVGAFIGFVIKKTQLRFLFLVSIIGYALSVGIAGVMVFFCHEMMVVGEVIYIGMFGVYGTMVTIVYIANSEFAILWMSKWPGFAGGIHGVSNSVGALLIPQIILGLRKWFRSSHVNAGTIFFCLGILKVVVSAPWLPNISLPHGSKGCDLTLSQSEGYRRSKKIFKMYHLWLVAIGIVAAFLPVLAVLAVQEPFLVALWNESPQNTPIEPLTAILMGFFLAGRVLFLLFSDKVGIKRVWVITLLAQMIFLLGLGVVILELKHNSRKYVGFTILCLYYITFPAFKSTMAGLCHDVFGSRFRLAAVSAMSVARAIGGIVGPVAIETIHTRWDDYTPFLFACSVLSLIGAVAILSVRKSVTSNEAVSSTVPDKT